MMSMLSLALPNGSLEHATLDLFTAADLPVRRVSERGYRACIDDPRIGCVRFLRPQEIAAYVERGLFDMGITGHDWINETDSQVLTLSELGYSKATSAPIRIVLAVPVDAPWHCVDDLPDGLRIATEFPGLTHRFLDEQCIKAEVMTSYGATEAKVPDIADAIVDLTETGSSLRENGLRALATLLTSTPELIANRESFEDAGKQQAMGEIASLLRSAGDGRDRVLLKMNTADPPPAIKTILGLECTVTHSYSAPLGMHSIEVVVPKKGINVLIPRLRAAGAKNIMELPLLKFMY
jgi:ATP phosphoribosyltransferase